MLQPRVYKLTLQGQHAEDAFVSSRRVSLDPNRSRVSWPEEVWSVHHAVVLATRFIIEIGETVRSGEKERGVYRTKAV